MPPTDKTLRDLVKRELFHPDGRFKKIKEAYYEGTEEAKTTIINTLVRYSNGSNERKQKESARFLFNLVRFDPLDQFCQSLIQAQFNHHRFWTELRDSLLILALKKKRFNIASAILSDVSADYLRLPNGEGKTASTVALEYEQFDLHRRIEAIVHIAPLLPGLTPSLERLLPMSPLALYSPRWVDVGGSYYQHDWLIKPTGQIIKMAPKKERFCSGSLITEELFLSAGHCHFKESMCDVSDSLKILGELSVSFNYQYPRFDIQKQLGFGELTETSYRILGIAYHGYCADTDFAVFELEGNPGSPENQGTVTLSCNTPAQREEIIIAHHPDGYPKKISIGRVVPSTSGKLLSYIADTLPGSSGAPVGYKREKAVVAVHTKGGDIANSGVQVKAIIETCDKDKSLRLLASTPIDKQAANNPKQKFANYLLSKGFFKDLGTYAQESSNATTELGNTSHSSESSSLSITSSGRSSRSKG